MRVISQAILGRGVGGFGGPSGASGPTGPSIARGPGNQGYFDPVIRNPSYNLMGVQETPNTQRVFDLATSRRKIDVFGVSVNGIAVAQNPPEWPAGVADLLIGGAPHLAACLFIVRPMLMMLSAITPRATQRSIPTKSL
jgi:hypothetical protein